MPLFLGNQKEIGFNNGKN